ncbi:MAG: glutamate--tRNA ligase [Chloroflexi bacterium]|nr:glutamate--tRNA ligase [Chloroflexota bacterium]
MMSEVRVRFAPSPTGAPHVGNVRTALFQWLWARHSGGKFILRIEDTDQAREVENGLELILDSLRFLGLDWDEGPDVGGAYGPYRQSDRLEIYAEHARQLIDKGAAYYCYCTAERLELMRKHQQARQEPTRYDRRCRFFSDAERAAHENAGEPKVVRLAVPLDGKTTLHDFIHGDLTIANKDVDDQVLLKSDGFPTYHLAVVVDDHLMKISHVMRGDDWVPSFPKHVLLYQAFGWEIPPHGHVPNVLGADKKKLSKRHGAESVTQFRDDGYLPEAMLNFLARLGWSYDDKSEIFSRDELIKLFTLDKIEHAPGTFDHSKLEWMNGFYIRQLPDDDLVNRVMPFLERAHLKVDRATLLSFAPLLKERIKKLDEAAAMVDFLFADELEYDPQLLIGKGMDGTSPLKSAGSSTARAALRAAQSVLEKYSAFDDEEKIEAELRAASDHIGMKYAQFFGALRVAVTGKTVSPPLMGSMRVLGRAKTLHRIERAVAALGNG